MELAVDSGLQVGNVCDHRCLRPVLRDHPDRYSGQTATGSLVL